MIPVQITPITPVAPTVPVTVVSTGNISENAPYIPPAILSLPPGALVKGFVLNRDGHGNPILRSNVGDFLLQSNLFLRIGSNVTVRVETTGANFRAAIIEVDGKPVQPGDVPQRHMQPTTEDTITRNPLTQNAEYPQSRPPVPQVLNAVLLSSPPGQPAALKPGTALLLNIVSLQLPLPSNPSTPSSSHPTPNLPNVSPAGAQLTAAPSAATTTSLSAANPVPTHPAISPVPGPSYLHSASQSAFSTAPNIPAPGTPTAVLPGATPHTQPQIFVVIGQERDGEPILQTPFGLVKITSNITLPTGTQLVVNTQQLASLQPQHATQPTQNLPLIISDIAQGWQSFREILSLFPATEGISQLATILQLPQLNVSQSQLQAPLQQFNAGLFLFMAALKGGDFRSWIGEARAKALEDLGHGTLLKKAETEFAVMSRLFTDTPNQQWQNMFLPILANGELQMVRYFSKRDRKKDEQGRITGEGNTRFIVEVSLSELGEMQLDGFYRRQPQERYFELVIRAHQPLDQQIQHDIIGIYHNITEAAGLQGSLAFQWMRDFPIHPLESVIDEPPEIVV